MRPIRTYATSVCVRLRIAAARGNERGDVPGWVMVTLMTAGIVAALWVFAEQQLTDLFQEALDTVRGGN